MSKSKYTLAVDLPDTEWISTGFYSLNSIMGGGLVLGSIVEIFGDESEGKTTLGLQLLAQAQSKGFKTMFLDLEHALHKPYLKKLVDLESLYVKQPLSVEETFDDIVEFLTDFKDEPKVILIDSIAAMSTEKEVEEGEDARKAAVAAYISVHIKNVVRNYDNSVVIFTNQQRDRVNIGRYGKKGKYQPGGNALKFYAGHRIEIKTISLIFDSKKKLLGKEIKVKVIKNKFGAPFGECTLNLYFGKGYSPESDILSIGIKEGIITASEGAGWLKFEDVKIQGKEKFIATLVDDDKLKGRILDRIAGKSSVEKGHEDESERATKQPLL